MMKQYVLRRSQSFGVEKRVDDCIRASGIVMQVDAMTCIGLDVRCKVLQRNFGESLLYLLRNVSNRRIASIIAIAAAEG